MQAKDIPTRPILEFLLSLDGRWANWLEPGEPYAETSVRMAMPPETPGKVALAKMRRLIKSDLVSGCDCGCRGDFELTAKGRDRLRSEEAL